MVTCYGEMCVEFSIAKRATKSNGDIFFTNSYGLFTPLKMVFLLVVFRVNNEKQPNEHTKSYIKN